MQLESFQQGDSLVGKIVSRRSGYDFLSLPFSIAFLLQVCKCEAQNLYLAQIFLALPTAYAQWVRPSLHDLSHFGGFL